MHHQGMLAFAGQGDVFLDGGAFGPDRWQFDIGVAIDFADFTQTSSRGQQHDMPVAWSCQLDFARPVRHFRHRGT